MAARTVPVATDAEVWVQPTFDAFYREMWWPMVRVAAALVDDRATAEDVVQDACAAVYQRWDAIRDHRAAVGYLRTAVVNSARSSLRRKGVARKHLQLMVEETDEPADAGAMRSAEHDVVRAAMHTLPQRQREVLALRYVAELSDAEIAKATGLSEGGVRSASSRALAALRTTLGGVL